MVAVTMEAIVNQPPLEQPKTLRRHSQQSLVHNNNSTKDNNNPTTTLQDERIMPPQGQQAPSSLKGWLLVLLVIQGSSGILTGRYTRTAVPEEELYEISHLVFVIECVKLILSILAEYIATGGAIQDSIQEHLLRDPNDSLKVLVPAVLYVTQNSLVYIALSNLEAPVFISLQQGKLIATALVSVAMLNRSYSIKQWVCLCVLAVGVAIVALDERGEHINLELESADELISTALMAEEVELEHSLEVEPQYFLVGVLAVMGACFSSAFAGVYFEKVLAPEKASHPNYASNKKLMDTDVESAVAPSSSSGLVPSNQKKSQPPSLWIRNMQLAFFSMIFAYLQGCYERSATIEASLLSNHLDDERTAAELDQKPYLHGFTVYVWLLVAIQACGGLLVAAVMKYADNVLKGLAMGVGVVVASVLSTILFDVQLSRQFALGGAIIFASVYCFSNDIPCCCALQIRRPSAETELSQESAAQ